jgi:hypothetical protein
LVQASVLNPRNCEAGNRCYYERPSYHERPKNGCLKRSACLNREKLCGIITPGFQMNNTNSIPYDPPWSILAKIARAPSNPVPRRFSTEMPTNHPTEKRLILFT